VKSNLNRKTAYLTAIFLIGIPVLILFWDVRIGVPFLLLGTYITYRIIRLAGYNESLKRFNEVEQQRIERQQGERGRTILVQLVDDQGRDLPEQEAQRLIAEAEARANPRDTVMGVHHVISRDQDA
jgi:hypothetical protein